MDKLQRAIFKTLAYSDIFDYPLTLNELRQYLIGCRLESGAELRDALVKLERFVFPGVKNSLTVGRIGKNGYYFLSFPGRKESVRNRQQKEAAAQEKFSLARRKTAILRLIPWIKLAAVTGRVAAGNADADDDIDLLIITAPRRLWLSRLLEFLLLTLTGRRRRPGQSQGLANKLCPNMYLSLANLTLPRRDLFTANELARVKVVWQRENTYSRFIAANKWVWRWLPNWEPDRENVEGEGWRVDTEGGGWKVGEKGNSILDFLERLARFLQLKYMQKKRTREIVSNSLLMFHPYDAREWVMEKYNKRLRRLGIQKNSTS